MKLIIDIPEEVYKAYCVSGYCIDDALILDNAIIKARPLDDVKAEIQTKEMVETNIEKQFYNMALGDVIEILDNIGRERGR